MGDDINTALRRAFELASMRKAAEALKTPEHWAEATEIGNRSRQLRETEERLFRERYDTRVEAARRRIIDEAGSRQRGFAPRWAGADRFDTEETLRQAQREVRGAHERRLGRIAGVESRALSSLLARSASQGSGPKKAEMPAETGPDQTRRRAGPGRSSG